jgi:hypothetical protein
MAAMTSDPMRRLPPELWSKVCACLDLRDAGNFRLSCRTLDAIGARFVLRELTVYLDPDAFDRLRTVADDPLKARCIRSLVYAPGAFYPLEHPDVQVTHFVPRSYEIPILAKLQAHDKYRKTCRDQARILSHDLDYELLAGVLPQLTGLSNFVINCEVGRPEHKSRRGSSSSSVNWAWCQTTQHPHTQHGKLGRRVLASLLRALDTSATGLSSLKALGLDLESLEDLSWTTTRPNLTPFFATLRNLNLQFCLCNVLRREPRPGPLSPDHSQSKDKHRYTHLLASSRALSNFLSSIPNLSTLAISFCYGLSASTPIGNLLLPSLEHVLNPGQHWPRLESISLGGLSLRKSLLMDLLESHKAMLRRVELFSVWLDADWPETLQEMRAMLRLEEAAVWTRIYCDRGQWHLGRPRGDGKVHHLKGEIAPGVRGERENLATAVGRYLVNGGECPVTEGNMVPGGASLVRGCYTCSLY